MNFLYKFEVWLITKFFERSAHFTQKWVGLDCFVWAYVCAIISIIASALVISILIYVIATANIMSFGIVVVLIIHAWLGTLGTMITGQKDIENHTNSWRIAIIKRKAYRAIERGMRNKEILKFRFSFVFMICQSISIVGGLILDSLAISTFLAVVSILPFWCAKAFCACTPDTPRKSKLKEGVEKLKSSIEGIKLPGLHEPEPSPV